MMYYIYIYIFKKNNKKKQLHKALSFKNGVNVTGKEQSVIKRISNHHVGPLLSRLCKRMFNQPSESI